MLVLRRLLDLRDFLFERRLERRLDLRDLRRALAAAGPNRKSGGGGSSASIDGVRNTDGASSARSREGS